MAGALAGTLILATIGAVGGWLIADAQLKGEPAAISTTGPTSVVTPSTVTKTSRSASPRASKSTPTKVPAGQFALPDLAGSDFEDARAELRAHNLGWRLVFGVLGDDRSVSGTRPAAGTPVKSGETVTINVIGVAPAVAVPSMVGSSCDKAKEKLVDAGLYPEYPSGEKGSVTQQDPQPGTERHWNDRVRIYCGDRGSPTP